MTPRPLLARNWSRHSVTFLSTTRRFFHVILMHNWGRNVYSRRQLRMRFDVATVREMVLRLVNFATSENLVTDTHLECTVDECVAHTECIIWDLLIKIKGRLSPIRMPGYSTLRNSNI